MAKVRDTKTKPYMPGENITVRLKQTDDDVANYLNLPGKSASEEFVEALRYKIEADKMNKAMAIKPEQLPLLNEIEKVIDEKYQQLEQRMVETLTNMIGNLSSFRDYESVASSERYDAYKEEENNADNSENHEDQEQDTEEAAAAMMNFGSFG